MNIKYNLYESFEKKIESTQKSSTQKITEPSQEQKNIIVAQSKKFKKQQKIAFLRLIFEHARITDGWDGNYDNNSIITPEVNLGHSLSENQTERNRLLSNQQPQENANEINKIEERESLESANYSESETADLVIPKPNLLPYGLIVSGIKIIELNLDKIPPELIWILIEFCDVCVTK